MPLASAAGALGGSSRLVHNGRTKYCAMCGLGVAASACLIVSNKILMKVLPSYCAPEALTLMHTLISVVTTRVCCPAVDKSRQVDRRWLLACGIIAMASVLSRNTTLQNSSVAFQQLARTASIPASAAVDYVLHQKGITGAQCEDLILIILSICISATGDVTAGVVGVSSAAVSCAAALGANMLVRRVTAENSLKPVEFMYRVAPWTSVSAGLAFTAKAVAAQDQPSPLKHSFVPFAVDPYFTAILLVNGGLSFGVQYLSTWAQTHCSYTGYAVLNQAKTVATVMLSATLLAPVSTRTWCGLAMALTAASAFTLAERVDLKLVNHRDQTSPEETSDSKPSGRARRLNGTCTKVIVPHTRKAAILTALVLLALPQTRSTGGLVDQARWLLFGQLRHQSVAKGPHATQHDRPHPDATLSRRRRQVRRDVEEEVTEIARAQGVHHHRRDGEDPTEEPVGMRPSPLDKRVRGGRVSSGGERGEVVEARELGPLDGRAAERRGGHDAAPDAGLGVARRLRQTSVRGVVDVGGRSGRLGAERADHVNAQPHIATISRDKANASGPLRVSFIIVAPYASYEKANKANCGGCIALIGLVDILRVIGHQATVLPWGEDPFSFHRQCNAVSVAMTGESSVSGSTKLVVVYPESFQFRCPCNSASYIHVLWMLSPMGVQPKNRNALNHGLLERRCTAELVFNYQVSNPGTAVPVPHSNLLQVLNDPSGEDEFQLWRYDPLPRNGTVFMMRKACLHHTDGITIMHKEHDMELTRTHTMQQHIHAFRTHEYFVLYDPYSYYAQLAAMLGCIPIIHPLANTTKHEWLLNSGYLAGYMEYYDVEDAYGIAYGWDDSEVQYARQTLHLVREQLWAVKEFANSVTVGRFVRDVKSAASGRDDLFEGAIFSHVMYPSGWWRHLSPGIRKQLGPGSERSCLSQ